MGNNWGSVDRHKTWVGGGGGHNEERILGVIRGVCMVYIGECWHNIHYLF